MRLAKSRWYLARYLPVNGQWETQVVSEQSWEVLWKAREAARQIGNGFAPFRGEILHQQKNLVFVTITDGRIPGSSKEGSEQHVQ